MCKVTVIEHIKYVHMFVSDRIQSCMDLGNIYEQVVSYCIFVIVVFLVRDNKSQI